MPQHVDDVDAPRRVHARDRREDPDAHEAVGTRTNDHARRLSLGRDLADPRSARPSGDRSLEGQLEAGGLAKEPAGASLARNGPAALALRSVRSYRGLDSRLRRARCLPQPSSRCASCGHCSSIGLSGVATRIGHLTARRSGGESPRVVSSGEGWGILPQDEKGNWKVSSRANSRTPWTKKAGSPSRRSSAAASKKERS